MNVDNYISCRKLAREAHAGQTRRGGQDYFDGHVLEVMDSVMDFLRNMGFRHHDETFLLASTCAVLHDALEDNPSFFGDRGTIYDLTLKLSKLGLNENDAHRIGFTVGYYLTRGIDESYSDYIDEIINGPYDIAIIVKYFDMKHNMECCMEDIKFQLQHCLPICKKTTKSLTKYLKHIGALSEAFSQVKSRISAGSMRV